jgi:hypothetical protein
MKNTLGGLLDTMKMMILMNIKDGDMYSNMIILFFLSFLTFIFNSEECCISFENSIVNLTSYFSYFMPKYNVIVLQGKRCMKVSSYITKTDNLFSNRFQAFWYYISKNNMNNKTIYSIKEYADSENLYNNYGDSIKNKKRNNNDVDDNHSEYEESNDIFLVNQSTYFKITNDIYCKVYSIHDKIDEKKKIDLENITIEIYSYTLSLKNLRDFLDKLDNDYKNVIENKRKNKKFIYTLIGSSNSKYDNIEYSKEWEECEFISTRRFDNLFFENKKLLMNKLDFFVNNKDWYDYEGHPYTFGIGLHGPPGTGKTSIIKCIANKLKRHIIVIPLNKIKTQREFSEYFFEKYYNRNNTREINFDNKIIVFEDIDCMCDIVKKRNILKNNKNSDNKNSDNKNSDNKNSSDSTNSDSDNYETNNNLDKNIIMQNKLLNKIAKKVDEEYTEYAVIDNEKNKDDKITLSFILNIIDGIRETPGRILIITSNNYESLDPALIRPGRIDMTLEMKNATIDTIKEIYNHYYKDIIPETIEEKIRDYVISPAKIINMRLENEKKEDFLNALVKEF